MLDTFVGDQLHYSLRIPEDLDPTMDFFNSFTIGRGTVDNVKVHPPRDYLISFKKISKKSIEFRYHRNGRLSMVPVN
jgi:hypothetical protein